MEATRIARALGRRAAATVLALLITPVLVACGGAESAPSEQVPALGKQLERVDEAVEAGDYSRARAAVKDLVARVAQAQVDGELSDEQAQRIVTAARSVLESLPDDGSPDDGSPQEGPDEDDEGEAA